MSFLCATLGRDRITLLITVMQTCYQSLCGLICVTEIRFILKTKTKTKQKKKKNEQTKQNKNLVQE